MCKISSRVTGLLKVSKVSAEEPKRLYVGEIEGIRFNVVAWATANAEVELSFACMFEREMPGTSLSGGLLKLDGALEGALTNFRQAGLFRAQEMETLLLRYLPREIRAGLVMVIGLGDPQTLGPEVLERALRVAAREAVRLGVKTVAFAPDLLDAGHTQQSTTYSASAMLRGVIGALEAERQLSLLRLAPPLQLTEWFFDAGTAHIAAAAEQFRREFNLLS